MAVIAEVSATSMNRLAIAAIAVENASAYVSLARSAWTDPFDVVNPSRMR
jgi:hypothetical protein